MIRTFARAACPIVAAAFGAVRAGQLGGLTSVGDCSRPSPAEWL